MNDTDFDGRKIIALGQQTLAIEAAAISALSARLDGHFSAAVQLILQQVTTAHGRLIVSGIGKSGHIARKIAATLSSTGTPAYFVHATEANHGDLGIIRREDVLLALSYSGESEELLCIVPVVRRLGGKIIAITGNSQSSLALEADIHLDASVEREACPLNLAPTSSTTTALALGDALAVALLDAQGFSEADFARSHPGGSLGRRLLTHVTDVMRPLDRCPIVDEQASLRDAILVMSQGGLGLVIIVADDGLDEQGKQIRGIFTDGDLRRFFERSSLQQQAAQPTVGFVDIDQKISQLMNRKPYVITTQQLAVVAVEKMQQHRINHLLVVRPDAPDVLVGALNMHDLFQAGIL